MLKILILVIMIAMYSNIHAQSLSTHIEKIEIDGKKINRSYKIFFSLENKWLEADKTSSGFVIPSQLENKEFLTVLITFGKYELNFSNIHISKFAETWIVGVDEKPFSVEFVTCEESKSVKRVYYIEFLGKDEITRTVVKISKPD